MRQLCFSQERGGREDREDGTMNLLCRLCASVMLQFASDILFLSPERPMVHFANRLATDR
jgi:hypothetical protein